MYTKEQLQNLFFITNMIPVRVPKGDRGTTVKLPNFTATYLVDLKAGEAIALLTDKGNWYLIGEEANTQATSNKRIIEYRKTEIPKKLEYYYIGIGNFKLVSSEITGSLCLLKKNTKVFTSSKSNDLGEDILLFGKRGRLLGAVGGADYPDDIVSLVSYSSIVSSSNFFYYFYGVGADIPGVTFLHRLFFTSFTKFKVTPNNKRIQKTDYQLQTTSLQGAIIYDLATSTVAITANDIISSVEDGGSCVVKYLDSSNVMRLVCCSFSLRNRYGAIVIWDIGTANEVVIPSNPACYFGRNYLRQLSGNGLNGGINVRNIYAVRGGIVVVIQDYNIGFITKLRIFVPESNLRGDVGKKASNLVAGSEIADYPLINSQAFRTSSDPSLLDTPTVGDIPPPLDTRKIVLDGLPFNFSAPSNGESSTNFVYYVSKRDLGKAGFT